MKMKSKIFGLNAKLALAVLAVGTMFTGCYDSENGDVVKPYEPLDPAYYVVGTITDAETGQPLANASVTVNGVAATVTDGNYTANAKAGDNVVEVECAGYVPVKGDDARNVNIPTVEKGQSYTAVVSVAMVKTSSALEVTVAGPVATAEEKTINLNRDSGENGEYIGLDLTAEEDATAAFTRNFDLEAGAALVSLTPTPSSDLQVWIDGFMGREIGSFGDYTLTVAHEFLLPAANWLQSVDVTYYYERREYTFTVADPAEECTGVVNVIKGYKISPNYALNHNFAHSHGHGHGHGENLNAGGGILDPEM